MKNKALTLEIIFEANSSNYGQSQGNHTELKKVQRENGRLVTITSNRAIKSSFKVASNIHDGKAIMNKKVAQFHPETDIKTSIEGDLFGYLITTDDSSISREGILKFSSAYSLENYNYEVDFATNGSLAKRAGGHPMIYTIEKHLTYSSYTVTLDLDKVGYDKAGKSVISDKERIKRVHMALDGLLYLYRDVKGSREQLSPKVMIGGIYPHRNPFFTMAFTLKKGSFELDLARIKSKLKDPMVKENTAVAMEGGHFENPEELKALVKDNYDIYDYIQYLKSEITEYYS